MFINCQTTDLNIDKLDKTIITYEFELQKRREQFEKIKNFTDPEFEYSPGVITVTKPEDIAIDEITGLLYADKELIITLEDESSVNDLVNELNIKNIICALIGSVPAFNLIQVKIKDFNLEIVSIIKDFKSVKSVSLNFIQMAEDTSMQIKLDDMENWHIYNYGIDLIWEKTKGGNTVIAVLDTGMDLKSSAFKERILHPYSVVTGSDKFEDEVFYTSGNITRVIDHGTRVSSVAGANTSDLLLYPGGIAPEAIIIPVQVFGFNIYEEKIVSSSIMVIEGIARAIAFKADIINLSLGVDYSHLLIDINDPSISQDKKLEQIKPICDSFLAIYNEPLNVCQEKGIKVVCSAGNDSIPAEYQPLPGHPYTITAGAVDKNFLLAGFSNTGSKVDCFAPGVDVFAVSAGNNCFKVSGTSFSAPYLSGLIALAVSMGLEPSHVDIVTSLNETSMEGRFSILYDDYIKIVNPIRFINHIGGNIDESDTLLKQIEEYQEAFSRYFIYENDSEETQLKKLSSYFYYKGSYYIEEEEYLYALKLIPGNLDYALDLVISKNMIVAGMVGRAALDASQLQKVADRAMENDFIAIAIELQNYTKGIPQLYRRIDSSTVGDRNDNTLNAIYTLGGEEAFDHVKDYLRRIINNKNEFCNTNEIDTCNILSGLSIKYSRFTEAKKIILESYYRIKNRDKSYHYAIEGYAEPLIRMEEKEGLFLAVRALRELDYNNSYAEFQFKKYQALLNINTDFGFKYDYLLTVEERAPVLDEFQAAIENCVFIDGIFRQCPEL